MIKTILATSDWHLRPYKRLTEYDEQFIKLIKDIEEQKPDRVVIAGDLFHNKITVSNESIILISNLLNQITKYSKIIIIPGNHDAIIGLDREDSITPIITAMNNPNIAYYKTSGCFEDKWDKDIVWCSWSCLEHQKTPEIKEYKEAHDPKNEKQYIGLYHGVIQGSSTDVGFTFTDHGIDPNDFFHTDFFIAGDIHKHQTFNYKNYKGEGFGFMCGSLIQQDFGETIDKHGYVLLEYNKTWNYKLKEIDTDYGFHTFTLTDFEKLNTI